MSHDLLLLSNSKLHGRGYLDHALDAVSEFLGGRRTVHFAPYALADHDAYTARVADALKPLGVEVVGLHRSEDPRRAVESAEVLFVGGGNSFRLLKTIRRLGLIEPVRRRVEAGELAYLGSSAGTNHACPTIRTTNDMPIVQPASFRALALVRFQINAHFTDAHPAGFQGETRRERLAEYLAANPGARVLGLPEGDWLTVERDAVTLHGAHAAALFRAGHADAWVEPESALGRLLEG